MDVVVRTPINQRSLTECNQAECNQDTYKSEIPDSTLRHFPTATAQ